MGMFDKYNAEQFKQKVKKALYDGHITREEFDALHKEFKDMNLLVLYAVSSWLSGECPGLEGALRSGSYENWVAATQGR